MCVHYPAGVCLVAQHFPVKFQGMLFLPFAMFGIHLLGSNIKFRMPSF
jgi:hypothetical protein